MRVQCSLSHNNGCIHPVSPPDNPPPTGDSCITSAGAAYVSGDDCLLVLIHHRAADDAHVIVADRGVYIKQDTIIAVMGATVGANAVAALTKTGAIRTSVPDAE